MSFSNAKTLVLAFLFLQACSVQDAFLQTDLFPCESDEQCGGGWSCAKAAPYAADFCTPDCTDTECDGVCVSQEGRSLCVRECSINESGVASECSGDGFSCIRTSTETDRGICYPVDSCGFDPSQPDQCGENKQCLANLVAGFPNVPTDNFYCVPKATQDAKCPPRSTSVEGLDFCLPLCTAGDTRCPPGFGCMVPYNILDPGAELPCVPGLYGVPCDDDTNCMFGTCQEVGPEGKMCTTSCNEANRTVGGCGNLANIGQLVSGFGVACNEDVGDDGGLCALRVDIGYPCNDLVRGFQCTQDLSCRSVRLPSNREVQTCTQSCSRDADCESDIAPRRRAYCAEVLGNCWPSVSSGQLCNRDAQCISGNCANNLCVSL